jgi:hypothetical protein
MILYRIRGRAELWEHCGMLAISPRVNTNKTALTKGFKELCTKYKRKNIAFDLTFEQLKLKTIKASDLVEVFATEDPTLLIKSFKAINRCTFAPGE